jgi:hypothetical protein
MEVKLDFGDLTGGHQIGAITLQFPAKFSYVEDAQYIKYKARQ